MATVKSKKQLFEKIKNFSYNDLEKDVIVLGNLIELKFNEYDSCIDVYKYKNLDDVDIEEYDFDSDYITTVYY